MRLYRFLNRFLFSDEETTRNYLKSSIQLSFYKICVPLHCSWRDKAAFKEDPECRLILFAQEYTLKKKIENKNLFQILG